MGFALRWALFLLVLSWMAIPSFAAKRINVAQLEQMLAADRAAHKSDLDIAKHISAASLSERLTENALARLRQPFASNSRTTTALLLLADRSAFLDPPAGELPEPPPPAAEAQHHLLVMAQKFAAETLPQLPNLLATRTTFSFDDSPQELEPGAYPQRAGMHLIGSAKAEVSVNKERSGQTAETSEAIVSGGLTSWGEFGSALLVILSDSSQGKTGWSHWESTPAGMMAVFRYEVPKSASHFEIDTSVQEMQANGEAILWAGARSRDAGAVSTWNRSIRSKPAYQGSLWIDPATGTITRLTIIADLKGNPRFERGAILVEYGPVQIANKTLICPLRSLALSEAPISVNSTIAGLATEWVNENLFTDYHLFSSSSRIVTEEADASPGSSAVPRANTQAAESSTPVVPQKNQPSEGARTAGAGAQTQPARDVSTQNGSPQTAPVETEAASSHADEKLDRPPDPLAGSAAPAAGPAPAPSTALPLSSPADDAPKLRIDTSEILVPVVVRDKQGHAIGNLTKDDFTVFDQGKTRPIRGFSVIKSASKLRPENDTGVVAEPGNPGASVESPATRRFVILLFDDRHVDASGLAYAQKAAMSMMDRPLASNDYAAVLSLSGANSGITQDREILKTAIAKLSVHAASQHGKEDCPDIDYYAADKIIRQHDPEEFQLTVEKAKRCSHLKIFESAGAQDLYSGMDNPTDPFQRMATAAANRALVQGEEDAHQTLLQVETVIRAMTKLQGQRIIILLSPGFLSLAPDAMTFKSQILDEAARGNVVINALDVRGLYAGNPDASLGENASLSQTVGSSSTNHLNSMVASENAMSELADGTGGTFFHNNNDLAAGLASLAAAPEYEYLLGISLGDVKANGSFHQLKVKVNGHDLNVKARRGYFALKH